MQRLLLSFLSHAFIFFFFFCSQQGRILFLIPSNILRDPEKYQIPVTILAASGNSNKMTNSPDARCRLQLTCGKFNLVMVAQSAAPAANQGISMSSFCQSAYANSLRSFLRFSPKVQDSWGGEIFVKQGDSEKLAQVCGHMMRHIFVYKQL